MQKATIHYLRTQRPAKQHKRRHQRDTRDETKACSKSKDKTFKRGFANKQRAKALRIKSRSSAHQKQYASIFNNGFKLENTTNKINSHTNHKKKGNTESKYSKQHHPKHRMQYTSTADNNARPQKRQYTSTISCKSLTKVEVW